jgi:hypothetical protein
MDGIYSPQSSPDPNPPSYPLEEGADGITPGHGLFTSLLQHLHGEGEGETGKEGEEREEKGGSGRKKEKKEIIR